MKIKTLCDNCKREYLEDKAFEMEYKKLIRDEFKQDILDEIEKTTFLSANQKAHLFDNIKNL